MAQIGFFEIHADDPLRAVRFSEAALGWRFAHERLLGIDHWRIDGAGLPGGLLQRPGGAGAGTNAFICSMVVDDLDAATARVLEAGAPEALPRFAVPGRSFNAYFLDTEGNTFALLQPDDEANQ